MLLKMIRSQNTDVGQLRMGVAYRFDMQKPVHAAVAKSLLDRKMAHETTPEEVAAEAEDAVARERATFAEAAGGHDTAIGDRDRAEAAAAAGDAGGDVAADAASVSPDTGAATGNKPQGKAGKAKPVAEQAAG